MLQTGGLTDICTYGSSDVAGYSLLHLVPVLSVAIFQITCFSSVQYSKKKREKQEESSVVLGYKRVSCFPEVMGAIDTIDVLTFENEISPGNFCRFKSSG